ncbi:Hypothetical predicted protein [Octopus vulgaris]|uniref:Uncharacterized protein n=1 Tax=Octopus vulgaris TaxID=6645 RepID=A0AA36F4Q1_OCTVU|nr:Hypothetical predicted protein [Octopus vulgaris]
MITNNETGNNTSNNIENRSNSKANKHVRKQKKTKAHKSKWDKPKSNSQRRKHFLRNGILLKIAPCPTVTLYVYCDYGDIRHKYFSRNIGC